MASDSRYLKRAPGDQQFDDGLALALALAPLTRLTPGGGACWLLLQPCVPPPVARFSYDREGSPVRMLSRMCWAPRWMEAQRDSAAEMLESAASRASVAWGRSSLIRDDALGVYRFDPQRQPQLGRFR